MKFSRPRVRVSAKTAAKYLAVLAATALLNFALPQREPLSFAMLFAGLSCGLDPFLLGAGHILASAAALSPAATLVCAVQACCGVLVWTLYRRFGKKPGIERVFYAAVFQIPFIFLFPHTGYEIFPFGTIWQKVLLAGFTLVLSVLFEGGLYTLLHRAFRCRLNAGSLARICLLWLFVGLGLLNALGQIVFYFLTFSVLLVAVHLLKNASAVPFSIALALPLCVLSGSAVPIAEYAVYACAALMLSPYGKLPSSLALLLCFLSAQYFSGLYGRSGTEIAFCVLSCAIPALLFVCVPEKAYRSAKNSLLFYRERALPRIAINRNRRAVGEQIYEVSTLFREIEGAFEAVEKPGAADPGLKGKLIGALCAGCPNRRKCEEGSVFSAMDRLIAVGCAKGQVNLIDLPVELSRCVNTAGLLFALNRQLGEYRRYNAELESAREGRRLLAEQARGVSEILRDIALEQSEEYAFSDEETALSAALASAGILSSEIFIYGEGTNFTASMTLRNNIGGKRLCRVAGAALGIPLSLSEKIPLTNDRACYILKRKPNFDAAFGVAFCPKQGETACGDAHSILKIDERRFLVALSDGMGSGEAARNVSDHTLSLLESFYKVKMPSETVLSTVNRLIAYSSEEMFACLDLASVNLDTGAADIVKIGSPVGFVLSGEELKMLEGDSLPMGMLEAVHPSTMRVDMKADDFLLFMSDGVTSAFGSSADLCAYLSRLRPLNPQSLAEEILSCALARYGGRADDDMTVLAVRLMKSA